MGRIFIEAGHNNLDPGAVATGFREADLTKELRDLVVEELVKLGWDKRRIVLDRDQESLRQTIRRFDAQPKDWVVSLHFNAGPRTATGVEVFSENPTPSVIGRELCKKIAHCLGIADRGVKKASQSARGALGILAESDNSLLLEVCFLSNPRDMKAYVKNKRAVASVIAASIPRTSHD